MKIHLVTLFPDFFRGPLGLSIPARAAAAGLVEYHFVDLRDFTHDRHRTTDDYPFGGGSGMVMKPAPFFEAVESLAAPGESRPGGKVLLMSARGKRFTHDDAVRLSLEPELTLLCGHYKDVDQRVPEGLGAEELSLGDFVLSGGEFAALAMVDAVVRLLPGAMSTTSPRPPIRSTRAAQSALVHPARGFPRAQGPRGPALGGPRQDHCLEARAGRAPDARAAPRPVGAPRAQLTLGVAPLAGPAGGRLNLSTFQNTEGDTMHPFIETQQEYMRRTSPSFRPGDTLRVNVRVREGEKERIQAFEGVCIARKHGGISETFKVRRSPTASAWSAPFRSTLP
jgi:tRNA (guanine37-N1)-methyltransferase